MKKSIILLSLFCLPFLAAAQWTINIRAGAGTAMEFARDYDSSDNDNLPSYSFYSTPGYSYFGGIDANYFFSSHLGVETGLYYSYNRSLDDMLHDFIGFHQYWVSQTLEIPVGLLWTPGTSGRSLLRFGFSANINLRHHEYDKNQSITYRDNPFFLRFHMGYEYGLSKMFSIGILLNTDITHFLSQVMWADTAGDVVAINYTRFYFTPLLTLRYQLFGHSIKKP